MRSAASQARKHEAAYPSFIEPCHPSARKLPPSGGNWIHEIKAYGYRAQVHVRNGKVVDYSRRHDWTETFGSIARAAASLKGRHAVLDGEAIVQDARAFRITTRCAASSRASAAAALPITPLIFSILTEKICALSRCMSARPG